MPVLSCSVSVSALAAVSAPCWQVSATSDGRSQSNQPNAGLEAADRVRIAQIDVAERQRAGAVSGSVESPVTSGRSVIACTPADAGNIGRDLRRVVGAGDGDRHVLRRDTAMMVVDLYRIGQLHRLAVGQIVEILSDAENVQFSEPVTPSVESVSVPSDSQPSWVSWSARPVFAPDATTPVMVTSCVSVRSRSVNVIVPLAVSGVCRIVDVGEFRHRAGLRAAGDNGRVVGAGDR